MIVSYNVYDADTQEKLNMLPVPIDEDFTWDGRSSGTVYRVYTTNLDQAGNESEPSAVVEVATDEVVPTESPMDPSLTAQIDQIVAQGMADGAGPGVGLYITSPHGQYLQTYGISTAGVPLTPDMHFRIGSATKPFTATAVLMAIQDGLLSLEDTIDQFDTPEFKLSDIDQADKIKIRHLMMMRSGVFNEQRDLSFMLNFALMPKSELSDSAWFRILTSHKSVREPGTGFEYVNANWFIISLVLRAVRGRHIRDIITEDIITPLGLTETSWPATAKMPAPYAVGHDGLLGGITTETHPTYPHCAGSLVSTLTDLHKWVGHMRDATLLTPEMAELRDSMFCPIPSGSPYAPPEYGYGLAWYDYGDWKGHAGSWVGYECSPMYHKESGSIIVCYENSQSAGKNGVGVQTFSQIFPEIARLILPDSMPTKEYTSCVISSDPFLGKPAPANLGYGGISAPITGIGGGTGSFAAAAGSDVFVVVAWDRSSGSQTATYGGVAMERVAVVYHNNDAAKGGQALFRAAGAGTGSAQTIVVSVSSGAWATAYGLTFGPVTNVGSVSVNFGQGTSHSHSVSNVSGSITLQMFSAAYGSSELGAVSGARRRAHYFGVSPQLLVSTTIKSGDVSALSGRSNFWASMAVSLRIAADVDATPLPAPLKITGGQPALVVDVANKVITPTKASLSISGGRPGGEALFPAGAALSVTGGTPTVTVKAAFEPFTEENVNRTNAPVPVGTTGAWVRLGGAGGGGGSGRRSNSGYRYGGGGGGGGAYIDVWVPVELMGPTYSTTRGLGGAGGAKSYSGDGKDGSAGSASSFSSGSVSLTANGGQGGKKGTSSSSSGARGLGGTAVITGLDATGFSGGNGGNGGSSPTSGQSRTNGAGAGGKGGGGKLSNDNTISGGNNGTSDGPAGNGGFGSAGGSGDGSDAGTGTDGYNRIEWSNLPNGGA
ncbi:minor tail protein [Mycobacterium phage Demsculpinboyz]|uniref:Minor tail protein n=1 Tax=Mycobacterium phage Demsculpinboyz TaxID=2041528 RepID=A0A2D1GA60_9CAUD|nr:minor tail protein [Mycobacterium phage Demsculpinboyz]ATN88620.1 minor tail protein [Mycobacterium phage Demsculpinboyz]